jgi:hypothetical protein
VLLTVTSLFCIIISAERRPLLDIGLPQSSLRRSVLRCPHPAASRDLYQIVGPPCGGLTKATSPGTQSPFEDLSAPRAGSPPRNVPRPLPLEVCNSSGYVGVSVITGNTHELRTFVLRHCNRLAESMLGSFPNAAQPSWIRRLTSFWKLDYLSQVYILINNFQYRVLNLYRSGYNT